LKAAALCLAVLCAPSEEEPLAVTNVRIVTVSSGEIESGTLVIRDGKFAAVGKGIQPPAGARVIDGKGLVAFPGIVHPASRLGLGEAPLGGAGVTPHHRVYDDLNPSLDVFERAARTGITWFGLQPGGGVVAGQGLVLKPGALTKDGLVAEKTAFLRLTFQTGTASKDALRQALDGARKAMEAEKKTPSQKPDDRVLPVVRFLRGEIPGHVAVSGAAELLHFLQVWDAFAEPKARLVFLASGDAYKAAEVLGARKAVVVVRPDLSFTPFTRDRVNPAAEFARAGATVVLAAAGDAPDALEAHLFLAGQLVKHGLGRDAALRGMTLSAAESLGIEKRAGSIEAGKDADLLLLDGDPLSAGATIRRVFVGGKEQVAGE
jgi:imidazolonepropionase-like amidohydrolase